MNERPSLLKKSRNIPGTGSRSRRLEPRSNRDGIGARITVKAAKRLLVDEVRSGSSYYSQNDMRVHFGLGAATKVDSVEVRWPSGLTEKFENVAVDQINPLKEGSGVALKTEPPKKP